MKFTITHPMHSHPYNPELVTGPGIAAVAAAAEAAGFDGFGFTDHPAPTQRWLESGGHDAVDPFVAMGFAAGRITSCAGLNRTACKFSAIVLPVTVRQSPWR